MIQIAFDLNNGNVTANGAVIAPLSLSAFLQINAAKRLGAQEVFKTNGRVKYGLTAKISDRIFGMNIAFAESTIDSIYLSWDGGNSGKKGYDATEKELISDKNSLSKMLAKILGKAPEVVEYNHDVFLFEWGYISTAAALRSSTVGIGVSWKPYAS